jgi:hypothetical protein
MQHHQRLLLGGWSGLGWITLLEEATKLDSICFLEKFINYSLIQLIGGGQRLPFFLTYSAKKGRKWITKQVVLRRLIPHKWRNGIPPSTSPKWNIIRHKAKAQKEATFFWSVIHNVMAVNKWRGKILEEIDKNCPHCTP